MPSPPALNVDLWSELADGASPDDAFRFLLSKLVQPVLKRAAFKKTGSTFHSWSGPDACKVVNFQRSSGSTSRCIRFTVNFGVYLTCLDSGSGRASAVDRRPPKEYDCHHRVRIGRLMPANKDHWWDLEGKSSLGRIQTELLPALEKGLGLLDSLASPRKLLEALNAGGCGLTSVMHARYVEQLTAELSAPGGNASGIGSLSEAPSITMEELSAIDVLRQFLEQNGALDPESLRDDPRYSKFIELAERFGLQWKPGPRCGQ